MKNALLILLLLPLSIMGQKLENDTLNIPDFPPRIEGWYDFDGLEYSSPTPLSGLQYKDERFEVTSRPLGPMISIESRWPRTDYSEFHIQNSDSLLLRLDSYGHIFAVIECDTLMVNDTQNVLKRIVEPYFLMLGKTNSDLMRKVEFYEKYFGRINGSLDMECVPMLPPTEKAKICPPDDLPLPYIKRG